MLVWDFPLRAFHWSLALAVAALYATGKLAGLWLDWHAHLGAFVLALMVFRIVWGFVGSRHARFASFFPTPARWRAFFAAREWEIGHSPLAALSTFALMSATLAVAATGLFAGNDDVDFHGPLYDLVSSRGSETLTAWHSRLFDALAALIGMHVLAIGYYAAFRSKNLLLPMVTGKVILADVRNIAPMRGVPVRHTLLAASTAVFTLWCIENGALRKFLLALQRNFAP